MNETYPSLEGIERRRYPPYGMCIYCGSVNGLSTEHIVPFGLGGRLELPQSSCLDCAKETSRVERIILRGELWPVRIHRALQSRRGHRHAPPSYPLSIERNGREETIALPPSEFPILVPFLDFAPPRVATGAPSRPGIDVTGMTTISFGPDPRVVLARLGASSIKPYVQTHPVPFARMIAKIAYSMAAATDALRYLKGPSPIRGVILGTDTGVGDYVGTLTYPLSRHEGQLHRIAIFPDEQLGQLVADVQLFSDSGTPRYGVLLGELQGNV